MTSAQDGGITLMACAVNNSPNDFRLSLRDADGNPASGWVQTIALSERRVKFFRGDCNNDGALNIADPQYSLNFQFLGGPVLPCMAAGDTNGDGALNIADPQYSLNFQFLGGPPPPAPFPACGVESLSSVEKLGCNTPCQ